MHQDRQRVALTRADTSAVTCTKSAASATFAPLLKAPSIVASGGEIRFASILRWSGSKAKLIPSLVDAAPAKFEKYIEPFAGSACLYFVKKPQNAILGDANSSVIDVYRCIAVNPHALADLLESIPKTPNAYYTLRSLDPDGLTLPERAARLIFLMKACFNGVYRTNKQGKFNVPMGNRVYALPSREQLLKVQKLLKGAKLISGDFSETTSHAHSGDWIYLDPPYRQLGRNRGEYGTIFGSEAMTRLISEARRLADIGGLVTISFTEDDELISKLPGWSLSRVNARRTVSAMTSARKIANEIILTSYQR